MKKQFQLPLLLLLFLFSKSIIAQTPTDNPYRTRYGSIIPAAPFHWTDSIRWNNVVNILDYANLVVRIDDPGEEDDAYLQNNWLPAFAAAQNALVASGGGVIFFPFLGPKYDGDGGIDPGIDSAYFFSDHLRLKSNVILRGETPPNLDARNANFTPPSYIEFPRYRGGTSVSVNNNTAFKEITVDTTGIVGPGRPGFRNIGLVYLDINRGRFAAHPTFTVAVANEKPRNVLILGIRSNNAAVPERRVPDELPATPAAVDRLAKRWSWSLAANIDVYVSANCIVAGCRMNDYLNNTGRGALRRILDNSFNQSNYIPNLCRGVSPCFPTPSQAKFDFNAHYGVLLNRLKKTGYNIADVGFQSNSTPDMEPELFAPGNMVMDNWIYKTSRVAIQAAGNGLIVKGNITKDDNVKQAAIAPGGAGCLCQDYAPNNTPTFENRGIDVAGWNVLVDNNTVESFRHKLIPSNKYSGDGEGWYFQGVNGTTARDLTFSNNTYVGSTDGFCDAILNTVTNKGFNGITNTSSIQNVRVFNNDNGGIPFRVESNGTPLIAYTIQGLKVFNNTKLHSIRIKATGCGDSAFVTNNTKGGANGACGLADLEIDCFTSINPAYVQRNVNSNTGFSFLANGASRSGCANVCPNPPTCGFPSATFVSRERLNGPGQLVIGDQLIVTYNYNLNPNCAPDSIVLYRGSGVKVEKIVGSSLTPGSGQAIFTNYIFSVDPDYIYAIVYRSIIGHSASTLITYSNPLIYSSSNINMYPNPTSKTLNFETEGLTGTGTVRISDLRGRTLIQKDILMGQSSADVSGLAKGTYLVQFRIKNQNVVKKLLID